MFRAPRIPKLSSVTFVDLAGDGQIKDVLKLTEHVTHVEYMADDASPAWD